ncbi:hypothetical protein HPB47_013549, partial [Ixodes persulcatus]
SPLPPPQPPEVFLPCLMSHVVSRATAAYGMAEEPLPARATTPNGTTTTTADPETVSSTAPAAATTVAKGRHPTDPRTATKLRPRLCLFVAQATGPHQGSLLVNGHNSEMYIEKLFSLLHLYGNQERLCLGTGLLYSLVVVRVVGHQNNAQFFDTIMQQGYSKQAFLNDVQLPFELTDGTPSFKDLLGNRKNHFTSLEAASKNRIPPPMHREGTCLFYGGEIGNLAALAIGARRTSVVIVIKKLERYGLGAAAVS